MAVADDIETKLRAVFAPEALTVTDESSLHAGHAGARPGGESHFHVEIRAEAFAGRGRVERQRLIYEALRDELAGPVHALRLSVKAPGE